MLQESLAVCGLMIKPPALIRLTGEDEAGKHKAWFATLKRAGYSSDFFPKIPLFNPILAEIKFPVILIITVVHLIRRASPVKNH